MFIYLLRVKGIEKMSFMEIFDKYSFKYFNVILTLSFVFASSVACTPEKSAFSDAPSLSRQD